MPTWINIPLSFETHSRLSKIKGAEKTFDKFVSELLDMYESANIRLSTTTKIKVTEELVREYIENYKQEHPNFDYTKLNNNCISHFSDGRFERMDYSTLAGLVLRVSLNIISKSDDTVEDKSKPKTHLTDVNTIINQQVGNTPTTPETEVPTRDLDAKVNQAVNETLNTNLLHYKLINNLTQEYFTIEALNKEEAIKIANEETTKRNWADWRSERI